ncbi:hypothetical protein D8Z77_18465 [Brevibacillus laterosporus]|nr:hypothetical protein D8Z77_18465 [Brevibacillus laterosporus]
MTLTRNLLFYNKFISFFITLLLLMEYPFYFKQKNKQTAVVCSTMYSIQLSYPLVQHNISVLNSMKRDKSRYFDPIATLSQTEELAEWLTGEKKA